MKDRLLQALRCPDCTGRFVLQETAREDGEVKEGRLNCDACDREYPIANFIPRFVGDDNYARGFGFQWHVHRKTQIDKFNGTSISRDRFYACTGWAREELSGLSIIEAGCGAGRFTEIMLDAGLEVFSVDYSNAVDACHENHGSHPNLHLIQGDICRLPFAAESFDRVFCFGVLQHTPDVRRSFDSLARMVKAGGKIAVDVYPKTIKAMLHYPRYLLRPIAKRLAPSVLYRIVKRAVPILFPISMGLKRIPLFGRYLFPLIPIANYWRDLPLNRDELREWSVIDTFDWLGSWYDQPQTASTLRSWLEEGRLVDCQVEKVGSFVGTGQRPQAKAEQKDK